ncbi:DUF481 domain-containing protein [Psychroflexus montanilacus]|uniref:DUF481 domain-containing protein n=1 Tax=Psychroflexus montanilacus TaxID=2873598 RepID=UPI001CCA8AEE|nr:DUF481 domain-containing protein [Psychroflexus montanilacus]MBZ9650725.1 DUF481 domain-containing protein [Psychroflexus montanilacus]
MRWSINISKNTLYWILACFIGCGGIQNSAIAQTDSIVLKNGNTIVGELKEMRQNVATVKTDYSDTDLKIKWDKIEELKTTGKFVITLQSGERYTAILKGNSEVIQLLDKNKPLARSPMRNIVFLKQIQPDVWRNFNASLSLGYNFTKANDLSQYSVRSNIEYRGKRWSASTRYNHIISSQTDVPSTERLDANLVYNYFLKKKWFLLGEVNWLTNTAQNISLRTVSKAGLGRYLVQTNTLYWGLQAGLTFNKERFSNQGVDLENESSEAFLGTEANLYNIGDLSLLSRVVVYPSLTESGRWRTDFNFDIKYDLPLDFFINFGVSLNYDNQPVLGGMETDYVLQTTLGWSL